MTDAVAQPINGSTSSMLPIVQQGIILAAQPPSHQPLETIGPGPLLGHSFRRACGRSTWCLWNESDLLDLMDIQLAIFPAHQRKAFFLTLLSLYFEAMKEDGVQLLWSLAKESTNCNIDWKINTPQSSGWKKIPSFNCCRAFLAWASYPGRLWRLIRPNGKPYGLYSPQGLGR